MSRVAIRGTWTVEHDMRRVREQSFRQQLFLSCIGALSWAIASGMIDDVDACGVVATAPAGALCCPRHCTTLKTCVVSPVNAQGGAHGLVA